MTAPRAPYHSARGPNAARRDQLISPIHNGRARGARLNGAAGFLLNYDGSRANLAVADKVADLDLDDVAPAQLAVDRAIAQPALLIKPNLMAQTCWAFNARLAPSFLPAFQGRRSLATGSYSECPIALHLLATVGQMMIERRRARDEGVDGREWGQTAVVAAGLIHVLVIIAKNDGFSFAKQMIDRFLALQLFLRVARTGSFSVAGRDVGLSQPSASRIVAALEKDVGVALFTRTTRGVTLTEAGSDYLIRAEAILAALEEANHAARGTGELRGLLRVAVSTSFAVRTVLPRLSPFANRHPKLRIEFMLDDAKQDLVGDSVDVALRIGTLGDTSAVARKIGVNPRVLAAAPAYLAEAGTPEKPSDLPQHSIIVGPAGRGTEGWVFRKDGKSASVRVEGRIVLNGAEGATAAAVAGLGITSSGALSMLRELERGQLIRVLPDWEMGMADIHVVLPAGRAAKPSARAFADFVSSELREQELVWDRICPGCLASGARSAA